MNNLLQRWSFAFDTETHLMRFSYFLKKAPPTLAAHHTRPPAPAVRTGAGQMCCAVSRGRNLSRAACCTCMGTGAAQGNKNCAVHTSAQRSDE